MGFTLIELLVAISIIALLSSVVLASLSTARMKARDAKRISDLAQVQIALEMHMDDHGYYPGVHRYYAGICDSPPCWDAPLLMNSTSSADWAPLENDLSSYLKKFPMDPLNKKVGNTIYTYKYGAVGRFGVNSAGSSTMVNTYDLFAYLEDKDNRNTCRFNGCVRSRGGGSTMYPCPDQQDLTNFGCQTYLLHP